MLRRRSLYQGWQGFTVTNISSNSNVFSMTPTGTPFADNGITSISYSTDRGKTWTTLTSMTEKVQIYLTAGQTCYVKGIAASCAPSTSDYLTFGFESVMGSPNFKVSGNIMSLLYGDSFATKTALPTGARYTFLRLFRNATYLTDAKDLILPATTLVNYAYRELFYGCTALTSVPKLPATTLTTGCYYRMFYGCSALTTAPDLLATSLVSGCYSYMFYNCSSLNSVKAMFTTTPTASYTSSWLYNVAASGTFYKNSAATWNLSSSTGVPSGWTVVSVSS